MQLHVLMGMISYSGLDALHEITTDGRTYEMRIDLKRRDGSHGYWIYRNFSIAGEAEKYRLRYEHFVARYENFVKSDLSKGKKDTNGDLYATFRHTSI